MPGGAQIADQRPGSPDGTDTVTNVENFQLTNRTYTLAEILNQPPELLPDSDSPHLLTEFVDTTDSGAPNAVSGTLDFTDDPGDTHSASAVMSSASWSAGGIPAATLAALAGAMTASISLDAASGELSWQFSLADRRADFLAVGETLTATYDVTIDDQLDNSDTEQVTVVFTGTNDTPVVDDGSSVLAQTIMEMADVTGSPAIDSVSGEVVFSDVDLNDRPTASLGDQSVTWQDAANDYTSELSAAQMAALVAALTITPEVGNSNDGVIDWTYEISDDQLDFLAVGESLTVTSEVVIDDGNGGATSANVVVTLEGSNDTPVATNDSNGTSKKSSVSVAAAGGVLANDSDPDVHDELFVSEVEGGADNVGMVVQGTYGDLTLNADGSYDYVATVDALPPKIVAQDTFHYTVADGNGGTDTASLNIVVFNPGTNYLAGMDTTLDGGNGSQVLDGSAGGNILLGGNGPDVLIGGDGNILSGGNGPDTFLFNTGFGDNLITDFNVYTDVLQFDASLFADEADVYANAQDVLGGVAITDPNGDVVTLLGVSTADMQAHSDIYLA